MVKVPIAFHVIHHNTQDQCCRSRDVPSSRTTQNRFSETEGGKRRKQEKRKSKRPPSFFYAPEKHERVKQWQPSGRRQARTGCDARWIAFRARKNL